MQSNAKDTHVVGSRSRKYDTYVPPAIPVSQSILHVTVNETSSPAVHVTSKIEAKSPHDHFRHDNKTQQIYLPPSQVKPIDFSPPMSKQKKKRVRKLFANSVMKATVRVDKVTRQSMKALRHSFEPPEAIRFHTKKQKLLKRGFYAAATLSIAFSVFSGVRALFNQKSDVKVVNQVGMAVKGRLLQGIFLLLLRNVLSEPSLFIQFLLSSHSFVQLS
jgi:hypothetical protein